MKICSLPRVVCIRYKLYGLHSQETKVSKLKIEIKKTPDSAGRVQNNVNRILKIHSFPCSARMSRLINHACCCCPTAGGSLQQFRTFTPSAVKSPEWVPGSTVQVRGEVLAKQFSQLLFIPLPRQTREICTKATGHLSCATLELQTEISVLFSERTWTSPLCDASHLIF